jgi:hypothetical protein
MTSRHCGPRRRPPSPTASGDIGGQGWTIGVGGFSSVAFSCPWLLRDGARAAPPGTIRPGPDS